MPPRGKAPASATADAPYALGLLSDEMTKVLAGSVSLEFDMATTCSLPSRNSPYNVTCAKVIWKDKEAPHKLFSANVKANELVFKRGKGADGLVVGFCVEDHGEGSTPLNWLHVVDTSLQAGQVKAVEKKKASNSVKPLKIGDMVTVKHADFEKERAEILGVLAGWYSVQLDDEDDFVGKKGADGKKERQYHPRNFRRADLEADGDEDDVDESEEDEEIEIIGVGREHAILDLARLSGITHIGLASAKQKAVLESTYYMNADDKGGGIQWMASRLGKLPAEITSQLDGEPGIDDARVEEEDSLLEHLAYMALAPIDERRAELVDDYMRMMNILIVDKFRKGTKGTKKLRLQLRLGYKALGEVLAHKVMPRASTSAAASACRVNLNSWTDIDKELLGSLQKAFKEAPSEFRYDVPASLLSMLLDVDDESDVDGSNGEADEDADDLAPKSPPARKQSKEKSEGSKRKGSGVRQKQGRGARKERKTTSTSSSTLQHQMQLAPATQALMQALKMQIDQSKAEKQAAEAENARMKVQLKAMQEQLVAAEDAKRQTENRYNSDMAAWVGPFTSNMLKIATAQGDLFVAGYKVQALRCVPEPLPWDIKSRPFNADSASARKYAGPSGSSSSFKFATKPRNLL